MDWLLSKIKTTQAKILGLVATAEDINSEPLMNCQTCQVQTPLLRTQTVSMNSKCCDFNPFVSGFAVGAWLKSGGSGEQFLNWTQDKGVLTCLGVAQPATINSIARLTCQFYSRDEKGMCAIWSQRPSVCRSYFCAHSSDKLREAREGQEKVLSELEAQLLAQWFREQGGDPQDWQTWIDYMDTPYGGDLPQSLLFQEPHQALAYYVEMWEWLDSHSILQV